VFDNKVLRRIVGPKSNEIKRKCKKLHSEELNDLYSSPNAIPVITLRIMRGGGTEHVLG
jgi:hypothetical protein